ncbi:SPFH domain-band 7 protein [Leptospira borgpetersenii str. Noumea 25]|nr:SPFH domain-band 7 protein [Leptospira borgpetersenii str. Noumea 25]
MALIDVIKYEGQPGEIVWKFPRNDISHFGQLVVNESQEAVFLRKERPWMYLVPGRIL